MLFKLLQVHQELNFTQAKTEYIGHYLYIQYTWPCINHSVISHHQQKPIHYGKKCIYLSENKKISFILILVLVSLAKGNILCGEWQNLDQRWGMRHNRHHIIRMDIHLKFYQWSRVQATEEVDGGGQHNYPTTSTSLHSHSPTPSTSLHFHYLTISTSLHSHSH